VCLPSFGTANHLTHMQPQCPSTKRETEPHPLSTHAIQCNAAHYNVLSGNFTRQQGQCAGVSTNMACTDTASQKSSMSCPCIKCHLYPHAVNHPTTPVPLLKCLPQPAQSNSHVTVTCSHDHVTRLAIAPSCVPKSRACASSVCMCLRQPCTNKGD
jgi:hypothetical protein